MTYKNKPPQYIFDRWEELNPEYKIDFSTDNECIQFLVQYFDINIARVFMNIDKGMYKADLWRLCKLYIYGGIYADIDLVPFVSIDELLKNNFTFYSCLAGNNLPSIFQAFIATPAKNPLLLSCIFSFLQNKPYNYNNGPTFDMYNVLKYNLNINQIISEKEYNIQNTIIEINIGSSPSYIKMIDLYYFPNNLKYNCILKENKFNDTFIFYIIKNKLYIERTDIKSGWDHKHIINLIIDYKQDIYLFTEKYNDSWVNANVKWNNKKIFDSRDLAYHNALKNNIHFA